MIGSTSKYRNVFGEAHKQKYEDIKPHDTSTEGSLIDVSPHFIGVSWSTSGGGCVAVLNSNEFVRVSSDNYLIRGHTAPVLDLKFSPFKSNLLATASDDSTVRIWQIPEEGLTSDLTVEQQRYTAHNKKVSLLNFHPTALELIASGSNDHSIHVWNILNGETYTKLSLTDIPTSLNWNYNGSLLGATTKDKFVTVLDPRAQHGELKTHAHDSGKPSKMGFLNSPDHIFTCGFNKKNERQIKLFDLRKFEKEIGSTYVDTQSGTILPYYDYDTSLIYTPAKGEGTIKFFEFTEGLIKYGGEFRSNIPQRASAFFPKRSMNYNKCELARIAKLTSNSIEYISFYFPKRNEGYDASIYPHTYSGEVALSYDEWVNGENRDPITKDITQLETKFNDALTFDSVKRESSVNINTSKILSDDENLKKEETIEYLTKQVEDLRKENEELRNALHSRDNVKEDTEVEVQSEHKEEENVTEEAN